MKSQCTRDDLKFRQANIDFFSISESDPASHLLKCINPDISIPQSLPQIDSDKTIRVIPTRSNSGLHVFGDLVSRPSPHRMVRMILRKISHSVIVGSGVGSNGETIWINWLAHSPSASHEANSDFVYLIAPPPGESYEDFYHSSIYRGVIENECAKLLDYEINLKSNIEIPYETSIGSFEGNDSISISGLGIWKFQYSIDASDGSGNQSRFDVSGIVSANCTAVLKENS